MRYTKPIKIKKLIIKLVCLLCFLIIANSALNIADYTAKNALAMGQMDIYGGQAFLQFYMDLAALRPLIFVGIIALTFKREIKALITKFKREGEQQE